MGALEAVLQYRAQEQAKQEAQGQQISQAFQMFQQARQQATENKMKSLLYNAQIKNYEPDNTFKRDELNLKREDNLRQNKLADALINNYGIENSLDAEKLSMQGQQNSAMQLLEEAKINASKELGLLKLSMEYKQFKSKEEQQLFENNLKLKQQEIVENYLKKISDMSPTEPISQASVNENPTLQDAFPLPKQKNILTPYISASGNVAIGNKLDPQYNKQLELRNSQIKELDEISKPVESFAVGVQSLRDAIQNTPDFKPGFLSGPKAAVSSKLAELNNEPWFTNYNLAYQQNFLPAAQALGSSKVLSDRDLENIKQSLGTATVPKEIKIKALNDLADKVGGATNSKLDAYGVNKDIYSKIYPNSAREFVKSKSGLNPDKKSRLEELRKKKAEGTLK